MSELYIGIMTGTSLDGIDIACVDFSDGAVLIDKLEWSMPLQLKTDLARLSVPSHIQHQPVSLSDIKRVEFDYTSEVIAAIKAFFQQHKIAPLIKQIKAIGTHGVTICHEPHSDKPFTWQIIDAHRLAASVGVDVIYDFRSKDVALAGQGAPLVPLFHYTLFNQSHPDFAVLNLGGIANVSCWQNQKNLVGFDTGPANTLLDQWINYSLEQSYDQNGAWAAKGQCNAALLATMLADPYFSQPYPKSTGKEYFNLSWLNAVLEDFMQDMQDMQQGHGAGNSLLQESVSPVDIQTTLAHLTAKSVAESLAHFPQIKKLAVCGGGVHNKFLMTLLAQYLPGFSVQSTDYYNVCPDNLEAMAFAWLAKCRVDKQTATLPEVTGCQRPSVLGAWVVAE